MKKIISVLLVSVMVLSVVFAVDISAEGNTVVKSGITYMEHDTYCEVVSCDADASGAVVIASKVTFSGKSLPVTRIGSEAFANCTKITSLTVPKSITSVGSYIFYNKGALEAVYITDLNAWLNIDFEWGGNPLQYANNLYLNGKLLTDLVIPDGVTEIKRNAFSGCTSIKTVTIPNSVVEIGEYAFNECHFDAVYISSLADWFKVNAESNPMCFTDSLYVNGKKTVDLVIPNGTTTINQNAFYGCSFIESVTIPSSLTKIGNNAFSDCQNIKAVYASSITSWLNIEFGYNSNPLAYGAELYIGGAAAVDVVIPDGVTNIKNNAFCGSIIQSVTFPSSLTYVGSNAFDNCKNLKSVYVNSITDWLNIDFGSSYGNPLVNGGDLYVGGEAVVDVVIPNGVTWIKSCAFYGSNIKSVTIPSSVKSIGDYAFGKCNQLERLNIESIKSWLDVENDYGIFYYSSGFDGEDSFGVDVYINGVLAEDVEIPEGVTVLNSCVFDSWKCLKRVTIPAAVAEMRGEPFKNCPNLTAVNIKDLSAWCKIDFDYNANPLMTAHNLYLNGELVTDLVIPEDVTELKYYSFSGSSIKSIRVHKNVTQMEGAFNDCGSLNALYIDDLKAWCEADHNWGNPLSYARNLYVDDKLVTELVIPDGVTRIGGSAFDGGSFASLVIPEGVLTIGGGAFASCRNLKSVTIPKSVASIEYGAFSGTAGIEEVKYAGTDTEWNSIDIQDGNASLRIAKNSGVLTGRINDNITWTLDMNTKEMVISGTGDMPDIYMMFDEDYEFNDFFNIDNTYYVNHIVEKVTIEDGITSIANGCFVGFSCLKDIVIPESVTKIGDLAFYDCDSLEKLVLPSGITEYGGLMFDDCDNLVEVSPNVMTGSAGDGITFRADFAAGTLTFSGNGMVSAGYWWRVKPDYNFEPWVVLGERTKTVIFEEGITGIGYNSLRKLTNVEDVYLSSTMTKIGSNNFANMDNAKLHNVSEALLTGVTENNYVWYLDAETGILTITGEKGEENDEYWDEVECGYGSIHANFKSLIKKIVFLDDYNSNYYISFDGLNKLEEIELPDCVTNIYNNVFYGCESLKEIIIPDSVTSIGSSAFGRCGSLTHIHIGKGVTNIGNYALEVTRGLQSITVDPDNPNFCSVDGVLYSKDMKTLLVYPASKPDTVYTVPDTVKVIYNSAFWGAQNLEEVILPEGLESINGYAFSTTAKLKKVNLPDSLTQIGQSAFYMAPIEEVHIGKNVSQIGSYAFYACPNVEELDVAEDNAWFTVVDGVLFDKSMSRLIWYNISKTDAKYETPDTVRTISVGAFVNSENLKSIVFNDGLETIEQRAAYNCSSMETVILPASLRSIGTYAFGGESSYKTVGYKGNEVSFTAVRVNMGNDELYYANLIYNYTGAQKGDANGDGSINNKDVVALFKLVSSGEVTENINVCDFNGDGAVNNKDIVALFKFVSKS